MLRGLYTSASGMMSEALRLDVVANNLANSATTGYKRDGLNTEPFADLLLARIDDKQIRAATVDPTLPPFPTAGETAPLRASTVALPPVWIGDLNLGVRIGRTSAHLTDGPLTQTDRQLDVAIQGDGFFTVATDRGVRYTRAGNFVQDALGRLATPEGHLVLADGAPVGAPGTRLSVDANGTIRVDGTPAGQLDIITSAELGPVRKEGANLWVEAPDGAPLVMPPRPVGVDGRPFRLQVGALEGANVQPVLEMVEMIAAMRTFETNQKAVQAQDETLGKAVNEVGRV